MFSFALVRVGFDFDDFTDTALEAGLRGRVASVLDAKVRTGQRVDYVEVNEEGGAVVRVVNGGVHNLDWRGRHVVEVYRFNKSLTRKSAHRAS